MADEDDDKITLSNLFKSLHTSSIADHSIRSNSHSALKNKKNHTAKTMQRSPLQSSATGDIVWAKIFPSYWFPGQIKGFKGSLISISLFGCNKIGLFNSSEILGFEAAFPRMVKMVGGKLWYEIGLALDEITRNIAVGLKCCCRVLDEDEDRSLAVKRDLNPQEILCFVREKAVSAQVFEGEIANLVRVSAALNAFQYGLVLCKTSEVDEEFCAEGFLDCVLDMAVNQWSDDKVVDQVYAFRRFASVKPAWFYQLDWELDDDGLGCRKIEVDLKLPDFTTEDALYHEITSDSEADVSINPQECEFLDMNHNLNGKNICAINMADFSSLEDDSLIYDQHLVDADGIHSAECTSPLPEVNADETAADVICASLNNTPVISSPQNDPNYILKVSEEINLNSSLVPNLEKATGGENAIMPFQSDKCTSAEVLSSTENFSIRTVPLYRGQLQYLPVNKCSIFSPIKAMNRSTQPQSIPEVSSNAINASQCIDLIPEMAPFAETVLQISANKRKLHKLSTFEHHKSPQNSHTCSVNNPIDEHLLEANDSKDAIKLHIRKQNHLLNHPHHVSKPHPRKRLQNHHLGSNTKSFYCTPLTRNELSLSNNTSKSSDCNKHQNSNFTSVLLNMKFPKGYALPSKEELAKKFSVFGPLDHSRTKIFFYTGVGQVVFLHQSDALVAYKYVTRKRIFGQANVRFWFYKYEESKNVSTSNITGAVHSSLNLKPCLRKSFSPELMDYRKNNTVRFKV